MFRTVVSAAAVTAVAALSLAPLPAAAAPFHGANTAAVQDDFNGDGYRDLAVGALGAANGSVSYAGSVVVLYGSASSVSTARRTVITQASPGVPGVPEDGDGFGAAVAAADLDRDGYADLLIGAPGEEVGTESARGSVTVVWGGPAGLAGGVNLSPPAGYSEGHIFCGFGMALATGDMTGDGTAEVSVGSRCDGVSYTGPFARSGQAADSYREWRLGTMRNVVMGDVDGDGLAERFWLSGQTDGDVRGPVHVDQGPPVTTDPTGNAPLDLPRADGYVGQVGDVDGDGYGDLVTGISLDDYLAGTTGAAHPGGEVQVLYGGADGIAPDQHPQVFHQDTAGVPGSGEDRDQFGHALSIADTDADGYADVLIGIPGESIGSVFAAGRVLLLHGSAAGLTTAGATEYSQNSTDVPGAAEGNDDLGYAVHLADLDSDRHPDLAVGAPGENGDGCVWVARGSATGPAPAGSANLCGKTSGITVSPGVPGQFGTALDDPRTAL